MTSVSSSAPAPARDTLNRRIHTYLGLYFLFFLWLFALTGVLLNHATWEFAQFWPTRQVTEREQAIQRPRGATATDDARDLMRQLAVVGEIEWTTTRADPNRFEFRVNRPGLNVDIKIDLAAERAVVQQTQVNGWGAFRVLHTFTGVRAKDTRNSRDWLLTNCWAFAMDALAVGLIGLAATGILLWWRSGRERLAGSIATLAGLVIAAVFVVGLRWFAGS
jgi:hypothetical protein